jgi:hypothetical protein
MADMLSDGQIKVSFVPTIASQTAPTVAELTAGTALECLITADGLDITTDEDVISVPKLCETTTSEAPGRSKTSIALTYVRKDVPGEDIAYTTLIPGLAGYLVVRRGIPVTTGYVAAQKVEVYPGKFGAQRAQKPEMNGVEKVLSNFYNSAAPTLKATVA